MRKFSAIDDDDNDGSYWVIRTGWVFNIYENCLVITYFILKMLSVQKYNQLTCKYVMCN